MNRRHKFVVASIGTGAALAAMSFYMARPKPVLQVASLFCVVQPWSGKTLLPTNTNYYWISNSELLVDPDSFSGTTGVFNRIKCDVPGRPDVQIPEHISPRTGMNADLAISPDGRWAAYLPADHANVVIKSLAGAPTVHLRVVPPLDNGQIAWSPDGTDLVVLQGRAGPRITTLHVATGAARTIVLPADVQIITKSTSPSSALPVFDTIGMGYSTILGVTSSRTVLIAQNGPAFSNWGRGSLNCPKIDITEVSLGDQPKVIRRYSPSAPPGEGFGYVLFSPTSNRLFWGALRSNTATTLEKQLHRYVSFVRDDNTIVEQGWTSNLDGTDMHELGYYDVPGKLPLNAGQNAPWILDAKWTPDGKRISFIYKDRIMTVPAE